MQNLAALNAINPANDLEVAIKTDLINNCPECHEQSPTDGDYILSHIECTYELETDEGHINQDSPLNYYDGLAFLIKYNLMPL